MAYPPSELLVLGAGIQGAGVALELARRGVQVTLVDQDPRPMNRASLRNEGKIHLGFIYAADASRESAFLQLEGALAFRATIERMLLPGDADITVSTPFHYLVAHDSLMSPAALEEHYSAIADRFAERLAAEPGLDYLGTRPRQLYRRLTTEELGRHYEPDRISAGFATAELAVDTDRLAAAFCRAIAASPRITFLPSHHVRDLSRSANGLIVEGDSPAGSWRIAAQQVVNATWERRVALDQHLGIAPPADLLHRLKYRVLARVPDELRGAPSVSMVLGRYGDVVLRSDGLAYLSWYPAGLQGWTHAIEPPADWNAPCRGEPDPELARGIEHGIVAGIAGWYRGFDRCQVTQVDAGAIVAIGRSDVDDASSGLHDRTRVGVHSHDGYHSVDAGKFTTAPLFALETADRVQQVGRQGAPGS